MQVATVVSWVKILAGIVWLYNVRIPTGMTTHKADICKLMKMVFKE